MLVARLMNLKSYSAKLSQIAYRADFVRKAPKVTPVQDSNATPDLSGWAGRAAVRDDTVTRAAQGVFMMALRATDRRVVVKGVYPHHASRTSSSSARL